MALLCQHVFYRIYVKGLRSSTTFERSQLQVLKISMDLLGWCLGILFILLLHMSGRLSAHLKCHNVTFLTFKYCSIKKFNFQLEKQPYTQQTIYGLQIGKEYEVHIRSRMQAFVRFGEFSDSIFIEVLEFPSKGK